MSSQMQRAPVRLGLVGAGLIGARHARMIASESDCELAGIADPSPGSRALAAELRVPLFAEPAHLLDAETPEAAVVATPTRTHVSIALECVARGLPALVEKPIADSTADARDLVERAATAGVPVAVGHHRRFSPAAEHAREIVHGGELGRLIAVSGLWALRKPDAYFAEAPWRTRRGGGPLSINLIHDIDLLRYCCGEIESVYMETDAGERGLEVEESGVLALRFADGALGSITFSDATPSPWNWEGASGDTPFVPGSGQNCYRFLGSRASCEFPRLAIWRHAPGGEASWTERIHREVRESSVGDALRTQLRHFLRVVRGEASPRCSAVDGLASLQVIEAARRSAQTGKQVLTSDV